MYDEDDLNEQRCTYRDPSIPGFCSSVNWTKAVNLPYWDGKVPLIPGLLFSEKTRSCTRFPYSVGLFAETQLQ